MGFMPHNPCRTTKTTNMHDVRRCALTTLWRRILILPLASCEVSFRNNWITSAFSLLCFPAVCMSFSLLRSSLSRRGSKSSPRYAAWAAYSGPTATLLLLLGLAAGSPPKIGFFATSSSGPGPLTSPFRAWWVACWFEPWFEHKRSAVLGLLPSR